MPREIVEDRLPAETLHLERMLRLWVKAHCHGDPGRPIGEVDGGRPITEAVREVFVMPHRRVFPRKSKPAAPSSASMREENRPPGRRSTVDAVVCQSSDAACHCMMSAGVT